MAAPERRTPPKGKPRARKLRAATGLRLPPEDLERIREDAAAGGLTVSEAIRRRYFGVKIVARADLRAVSELRRVAGLLKHIAAEHGASPELRAALDATRAAIERIAAP